MKWVVDELSTHTPAAFYRCFEPEEARRLKHGSWLNIEAYWGESVREEVERWAEARNEACATVMWRFTTQKARKKLHRLYQQ